MPLEIPRNESGKGLRIAVVRSRFNEEITAKLLAGALGALARAGVSDSDILVAEVPGAWEIPFILAALARRRRDGTKAPGWLGTFVVQDETPKDAPASFDALVAIGAVVRGETAHFEFVARGFNDGALATMQAYGIPVGNGVLTTEDEAQALARAGGAHGNKGAEAALAAVEMANLARAIAGVRLG